MPSRAVSSPSRSNAKLQSGIPKKKKTHKSKSVSTSRSSLNLSRTSPRHMHDQAELVSAAATQNGMENISLLSTRSGRANSGGNHSLGSTFRSSGHNLTSPNGLLALTPEQDGLQPAHPPTFLEPAPKLCASHSSAATLFYTPASTSLPTAHRDPLSVEPLTTTKKAASAESAQARGSADGEAGLIRKKPPLRRAAVSQPNMFNTSPVNAPLAPAPTAASASLDAALVRSETQQFSEAPAATAAVMVKSRGQRRKASSPSPQPQLSKQENEHPTAVEKSAAAAAVSAFQTPVTANLTPSPRPLEPRVATKPPKEVTGKANTSRSPPPQNSVAGATRKVWSPPMNTHDAPEYLPTDLPNVVVPARKYAYDVKTCTWREIDTMIRVLHPNRGVSQGAMRVCFVVEELDERGFSSPMVAKMFRHNLQGIVEADYFNEGEAQCICGVFADKFNKVKLPKEVDRFVISFLQCDTVRIRPKDLPEEYQTKRTGFFSYRTTDTKDIIFTMEPRLKGNFTKYTNNFGAVYEGFEERLDNEKEQKRHKVLMAVEAFSHFTLEDSGGSMLVCDLQGVNDFLTDPQIHTVDGKGLGMGNMGRRGINKWVEKHECNSMCRALGLQPLSGPKRRVTPASNVETRVSYYKVLRSNLRSQAPTRPEDLIPLPKPLSEMTDDERLDYAIRLSQLLS
jgi:myosin-heavy-chain kinase